MATYSEVGDLLLGDMPNPRDAEKWVQDATDEINSKLGIRYVVPIVVDQTVPANLVTVLLLKRINNHLASGRLVCAKAASGSQQEVHQYGMSLLREAISALNSLVAGDMTLPGAPFVNSDDVGASGPIISNLDVQSNVESFYNMVTTPARYPGQGWPVIYPAGSGYWSGGYRG